MYNKKFKKIMIIVVWLIVAAMVITTFSFAVAFAEEDGGSDQVSIETQLEQLGEVLKFIEKNYADDVSISQLIDGAYQGVFEQLDPYSKYYGETAESDSFMSYASGEYYGIGAIFAQGENGVYIKEFTSGSAAQTAGIQAGDRIISIDGVSMTDQTAAVAAAAARGANASTAVIVVERNGKKLTYRIKRALMHMNSVSAGMLADETVAYIDVNHFYSSTTSEFQLAWDTIQEKYPSVRGLVIDLRDNTGGLMSTAITMSNLFLDEGDIIMSYMKQGKIVYTYRGDGERTVSGVPVMLLVNDYTASAAEVFAAALQDNGEAVLVGAPTYGKGLAQTVATLDEDVAVKLSIYYFLTPENEAIHGKGVTPSFIIYNGDNKTAIQNYKNMKTVAELNEGVKYSPGQRGLNVYASQQRLKILGYDVPLNGLLDEATVAAVKDIQRKNGLYVYGALDFTTMDCINKIYRQNVFGISEDVQLKKALALFDRI